MYKPVIWYGPRHCRYSLHKLCAVDDVRVIEHAFLERHDDELRVWKVGLDHPADVLGVAQIKGSIHLPNFTACLKTATSLSQVKI